MSYVCLEFITKLVTFLLEIQLQLKCPHIIEALPIEGHLKSCLQNEPTDDA